jgi:methionyl-tRNA formyltransferase
MRDQQNYIVAGTHTWNRTVFDEIICRYPGNWHFISQAKDLMDGALDKLRPRYIFFLHWSWKVPSEIINSYECVCFHMTDVPYGRGGSPLQNLIVRGHCQTKLTALRMVDEFDAGPVYAKEDLCLEGSAENIYIRASRLSAKMIADIIDNHLEPKPQIGEPTFFKRRTPAQSRIPDLGSIQELYDFIRMLDANGYPKAFWDHGGARYEFSRAGIYNGKVVANVVITPIERKNR